MKKTLILLALVGFGAFSKVQAQNIIFSETFDNDPVLIEMGTQVNPDGGWQSINSSDDTDGWRVGTTDQINGSGGPLREQGFGFFGKEDPSDRFLGNSDDNCKSNRGGERPSCNKAREIVVSPRITLPTGRVFMAYDAFFQGLQYRQSGATEACSLLVSRNDGTNWTPVAAVPVTIWGRTYVDISSFAGATVRIGFRYEDAGTQFLGIGIDNIEIFTPLTNDALVTGVGSPTSVLVGEEFTIRAGVFNKGTAPIRQLELRWRSPEGIWVSDVQNLATAIAPLTSVVVEHRVKAAVSEPGENRMNFDIRQVNTDVNIEPTNVTREWTVNAFRAGMIRRPLMEDFTGAWCGWCPRGHIYMDCAKEMFPGSIPVAVHFGNDRQPDNMVIPEGLDLIRELRVGGFPSFAVDRTVVPGENSFTIDNMAWWDGVRARLTMPSPAHARIINRKYNPETRELEATVEATFLSDMDYPSNMNLLIVEDAVVGGTGSGWDQVNYMSNTVGAVGRSNDMFRTPCNNNNPNNPLFARPREIPNREYPHNHTLRKMVEGIRGKGNILAEAGKSYTQTFNFTLPAEWKAENINLVGIVQGNHGENLLRRDVMNADEVKLLEDYVDAGPGTVVTCGTPQTLKPYLSFDTEGAVFSWAPADGLSSTSVAQPTATPTQTTVYTLTVTKGGKSYTDSLRVRVLPRVGFIPSAQSFKEGTEASFLNTTPELNNYTFTWEFEPGKTSNDIHGKYNFARCGDFNVKLTATKDGQPCGETITKLVRIFCTSVEEAPVYSQLKLYPNPTQGSVFLNSGISRNVAYKVFNLQGQVVSKGIVPANASNFEVDLAKLPGGIYMMQLTDGESVRSEKIVKND